MAGKTSRTLNIVKVSASYIGAVVGAGFTSGQELMQFFVALKGQKIPALFLVTFLFMVFGWATLYLNGKYQCRNYYSFLQRLLGRPLARLLDLCLGIFLFSGLSIMLSAMGALFSEHFALSSSLGIGLLGITVIGVLVKQVYGLLWINTLILPFKFTVILVVAGWIIGHPVAPVPFSEPLFSGLAPLIELWWLAGVIYVSYNLFLGLAVLVSLGEIGWQSNLGHAGLWGGLGLGVFAGAIVGALSSWGPEIGQYQVPMVYLAQQIHPGIKVLYIFVLGMGMLTTSVSCAHALTTRLTSFFPQPYFILLSLTTIAAMPLAHHGFARLVSLIYPFFGYVGLLLLFGLTWRTLQTLPWNRI